MIGQTAEEFIDKEVAAEARSARAEGLGAGARRSVQRCGELGLLATDVPEAYGGLDLDKVSSVVVGEAVGRCASFATTFGAQTGLAITPILCFGTEEQKQKYLPRLVTGGDHRRLRAQRVGIGLRRARRARARARGSPTAASCSAARRCGSPTAASPTSSSSSPRSTARHFTAFIVERGFPGVSTGKEEHKLGLLGSSTTPLILQDAKVPAANLLGEIGKGHKIAFNTLNYGRLKLGAMCSGGARLAIEEAARYAAQRKQFGKPIASFGAIKQKLGDMVARQYAVEAMLYRTDRADRRRCSQAGHAPAADPGGARGVRHRGVDPQGREQRGARLHPRRERPDPRRQRLRPRLSGRAALPRRARQPHLRGHQRDQPAAHPGHAGAPRGEGRPAADSRREAADGRDHGAAVDGRRSATRRSTPSAAPWPRMKKVALMVLGTAMQTYGEKLADEQEVLLAAADIIIDTYASESALLRALRRRRRRASA